MGRRVLAVRMITAGALLLSVVAGCGGGDEQVAAEPSPSVLPADDAKSVGDTSAANAALPDLQVVRVASGATAQLRTLAVAGKPTLLWFWAPHCTFCRAEAPALLEFAKTYGDQVQILGLGAQDNLDQAVDFLADTSTQKLEMVWDASGKSWLHYKVTNQPTVVVLDAQGKVTKTWFRHFDAKAILDAVGLKA